MFLFLQVETLDGCEDALVYSVYPECTVVHIFDPPSLLKDVRNLFIKHNVHFMLEGHEKFAEWSVITEWHEITQRLYHGCVYVSDEDRCKTQLAAKIFSYSVYQSIYFMILKGEFQY